MASATDSIAGLLLLGDANNFDIDVSNLLDAAPLFRALPAVRSTQGTSHKYLRTTNAAGSGFRALGAGQDNAAEQVEQVTVSLKMIDGTVHYDRGAPAAGGMDVGTYAGKRSMAALKAAFAMAESQLIEGTGNESDGFAGFNDSTAIDSAYDAMVVNAGGTGGNSVYLIRAGEDGVAIVTNGVLDAGGLEPVAIWDGSAASYPGYQVPAITWAGLQIADAYSIARITNVTAAKPLTDDLISDALALAPVGKEFTHIVMGRTELKQLQQSRTATSVTGAPAPFPTEAFGVQIIVTDALASNAGGTAATTTTGA